MRRAGIVQSTRGARGGYALARPADQISIRDVIEASESTTFDLHCMSHPVEEERCSSSHTCSIRPVWMLLQRKIDDVLEGVRLADLLAEEGRCARASGCPICLTPSRRLPARCRCCSASDHGTVRALARRAGPAAQSGALRRGALSRARPGGRRMARRIRDARRCRSRDVGASIRATRHGTHRRAARRAR